MNISTTISIFVHNTDLSAMVNVIFTHQVASHFARLTNSLMSIDSSTLEWHDTWQDNAANIWPCSRVRTFLMKLKKTLLIRQ